ncbi:Putative Zinc transporter YKE4 [Rhizopus microsporus]|nr:Putative Zinc transporter YKE4 [Rhizopus microsporus]
MRLLLPLLCPLLFTPLFANASPITIRSQNSNDWSSRVIYQLLTDRFAKTVDDQSPCSNLGNYCGGSFQGIINHLDYIAGMGFDAIWISPIPQNSQGGYHGATTAVAVFFHEIPHEVGDYAILVQSGFSKKKAMMAQFTTAVGAFLGTFIGIMIEESSLSSGVQEKASAITSTGLLGTDLRVGDLVIPFAAGGFLYIATVGVIPELLDVTGNLKKDRKQAFTEFAAMLVGLGLMFVIAWNDIAA